MTHPNNPPYQLPPTGTQQPLPPPAKKTHKARIILLGVLGAFIVLVLLGSCISLLTGTDSGTSVAPAPTVTVTVTEPAAGGASAEANLEPSKAPAPKEPAPAKATMDEGTYEIGVDAPAGRYKTVAEDSCYWKRSKDDSGTLDSILANDNVNDGARASVTVKKGEFFTSEGCGTWTKT